MDPNESATAGPSETHGSELDLERLADKVYKLMQEELRLEAARGGKDVRRRK